MQNLYKNQGRSWAAVFFFILQLSCYRSGQELLLLMFCILEKAILNVQPPRPKASHCLWKQHLSLTFFCPAEYRDAPPVHPVQVFSPSVRNGCAQKQRQHSGTFLQSALCEILQAAAHYSAEASRYWSKQELFLVLLSLSFSSVYS